MEPTTPSDATSEISNPRNSAMSFKPFLFLICEGIFSKKKNANAHKLKKTFLNESQNSGDRTVFTNAQKFKQKQHLNKKKIVNTVL